jgi:two-component system, OmpR family, sensor kinase
MRSILRTLPIRWQIPALYAAILALVLAAGGLGLWNAQYQFQHNTLIAQHATEMRALIPEEFNDKVRDLLFPAAPVDRARLKALYPKIIAEIFPPNQDPVVSFKKLGFLNPKLVSKLLPSEPDPDATGKQAIMLISKLGPDDLFPPDENPADTSRRLAELSPSFAGQLFAAPQLDQDALKKWSADLAQKLGAKDRGAVIFALDGTLLAQSNLGPACQSLAYASKRPLAGEPGGAFFDKLRKAQYLDTVDQGQLTLLMPMIWLPEQNRPVALVQVCVPTDSIDTSLNQLAISLLVAWVLIVGLATALGVTATRRVLRPLDQVIATTGQIAAGDLRQRVGLPPGRTEIAQLGAAFDAMVERLEVAFAAQRRFVADAAHELRTPLTALSASVELLLMGAAESDPATARRLLRHLDRELSRVIRLTNDLLTLSRLDARPQIELRPTDLSALLDEVGEQSRALLRGQELQVYIAPGLCVQGDPDRLRQIVLNLLDNARKYTPPGGQIVLRAYVDHRPPTTDHRPPTTNLDQDQETRRSGDTDPADPSNMPVPGSAISRSSVVGRRSSVFGRRSSVVVEVEDTGAGIPAEALPHLFERFYRVDSARTRASGGSGLGLAIVQAIVEAHGGEVAVQSAPGEGACVTIRLPRQPPLETLASSSP